MAGTAELIVDEADVLTVEREVLQALIAAVRDGDDRVRAPSVDPDAMRAIELTGFFALAAPGSYVFRFRVVLVDPAQAVAVGNVDAAAFLRDRIWIGVYIAREYGLPALANVKDATRLLKTGDRVKLDASAGRVQRQTR